MYVQRWAIGENYEPGGGVRDKPVCVCVCVCGKGRGRISLYVVPLNVALQTRSKFNET